MIRFLGIHAALTGSTWAQVRGYSTQATWTWDTVGLTQGTYYVQVDVRSVGSTASKDAAKVVPFAPSP